ncbi:MAG: IS110 family transposase [Desulfuromonadales bacterium]|nr:IS110 family transposase [Desulfuromonadales bacterium]
MTEKEDRLQQFRELRTTIRGSETILVVGVDIAKNRHHAFFGGANGKTLWKKLIFDNNIQDFKKLQDMANNLMARHGLQRCVYGVEPTASYHKPLAEYLIRNKEQVVYVSNVAVKHNRALLDGRWDKNDTKDAANIADLVGQGRCQFYDLAENDVRELRSLLAYRAKLKKQEHALRMRIRNNLLAQYFPELDKQMPQGGQDGLILDIIAQDFSPAQIADIPYETFRHQHNLSKRHIVQEQRLRTIWEASQESVGCSLPASAVWEGKMLVNQIRLTRQIKHELEGQLKEVGKTFPAYHYLLTIPGFGPIVSSMTLAAIGDAHHFTSRKQVLRLAGLDLSASRSGKTSNSAIPVISKQGKVALRYALYQAATIASYKDAAISNYFTRLLKGRELERGIKMKMRIKLAAKLLVIAWTLMKRNEVFDSGYFKT